MIMIYVTCGSGAEANKIAKCLVSKELVACINIFPVKSIYRWKGKIVNDKEVVIIGKTLRNKFEIIKKEIKKMHSYEVPCIAMFEIKADKDFEKWAKGVVG